MTTINSSLNNADNNNNSWGDMIRTIDHERKNLSWNPNLTLPVQKIGHYDVKKKEREYDIIALQYRNPEKESIVIFKKEELLRTKLKSANDIKRNEYNFISHTGPPRNYDQMISNKETIKPVRQYNFFSNMNHADHHQAPTIYDDDYTIAHAGRPKVIRPAINKGEYNIINNYFFEKHDERITKEFESFKDHTLQKYWQTHDYDPIRGKYYDIDKEIKFQQQREIITQVHGAAKDTKIPPSILYSDGNAYNIVNHSIQDEDRLEVSNTVANRSLNRMVRSKVEKKLKEDGQVAYDEAERSRLARIKFTRWKSDMDRGYDLVKNTVIQSNSRPQPLPARALPLWGKLQHTTDVSVSDRLAVGETVGGVGGRMLHHSHSNNHIIDNNNEATATQEHKQQQAATMRTRNLSGAGPTYTNINTTMNSSILDNNNNSNNNISNRLSQSGQGSSNHMYLPPQTAPARAAASSSSSGRGLLVREGVGQLYEGDIQQQVALLPAIAPSTIITTARARTAAARNHSHISTSSQMNSNNNNQYNNNNHNNKASSISVTSIPSLDLSKAEQAPKVSYIEPTSYGPSSMPIAMVRTGGFASYRSNQ